jgi:hypothetical protein
MKVVVWSFWGRRPNIELQLPLIERLTSENENVQFHGWNLARLRTDNWFVRCVSGQRITIHNEYYNHRPRWLTYNDVYRYYSTPEWRDHLFVKIDDDVVFFQTGRFQEFLKAVDANPGSVVSADVINNGACARHQPGVWSEFAMLGVPQLDWHKHESTAQIAHEHFFANWRETLTQPMQVVPTEDWLSINMIGYDWQANAKIAEQVGKLSPPLIADRCFGPKDTVGDEGSANMLPRKIVKGFTAAHLTFGPQDPSPVTLQEWRDQYGRIGRDYLEGGVGGVEQCSGDPSGDRGQVGAV